MLREYVQTTHCDRDWHKYRTVQYGTGTLRMYGMNNITFFRYVCDF